MTSSNESQQSELCNEVSDTDRQQLLSRRREDKRHIHRQCARYSCRRNVVNGIHLITLHKLLNCAANKRARSGSGGLDSASSAFPALAFMVVKIFHQVRGQQRNNLGARCVSLGACFFTHFYFILLCFKIHNHDKP